MAFRTLHDRIIVRRADGAKTTAGGIILAHVEKAQEGEALVVGPGKVYDGNHIALSVKVGDHVLFGKNAGAEIKINGETLLVMKEEDVFGIMAKN